MELENRRFNSVGKQTPNTGSLATPNKITIGYLKQDLDLKEDGRTVQEEAEQAFQKIKFLEQKIEDVICKCRSVPIMKVKLIWI